jgi:hypothetical protein
MNEPVAMRYEFDGYGYKYIDSGSGSDWQTREKGEFLYTKPFFSQKPVAMMVKIDGFDKPEFTTICGSAALKHPNYTALYDHPPTAFAELEEGQSIPLYEHPETLEDRESAIYATGYYKGFEYKRLKDLSEDKESFVLHTLHCNCGNYWNLDKYPPKLIEKTKNETLDTRSYLIGRYDGLRELTDGEILNIYLEQTNGNKDLDILDFAKAILKKASER